MTKLKAVSRAPDVEAQGSTREGSSFTVGDRVRLNSGGPELTVRNVDGDSISCDWFDGATLRQKVFDKRQLVSASRQMTNLELARRIAFIFNSAIIEAGEDASKISLTEIVDRLKTKASDHEI